MKYALILVLLALASCQKKSEPESQYIVKYGDQKVYAAEFINKMMTLGFVKYGKPFYTRIYDKDFFENMRSETLEHILNSLFVNKLSRQLELKVTNDDVQNWIQERAPVYSQEDLVLTLQANNLNYKDWTNLFREQLVQHRISIAMSKKLESEDSSEKSTVKKEQSKKQTHYQLAVLTFENQLDADQAYKKISNSKEKFNKELLRSLSTQKYSWLTEDQIPFFSKIKKLRKGRVSKPFETEWGFLLVRVEKKEKRAQNQKKTESLPLSPHFKSLVEEFKKDPKLHINSDLLYSLKIQK